jgi:hypothetical protein
MNRRVFRLCFATVLASVACATSPVTAIDLDSPIQEATYCCADMNRQACSYSSYGSNTVYCSWGYYGPGRCTCYGNNEWECYSYVPVPSNPDHPVC